MRTRKETDGAVLAKARDLRLRTVRISDLLSDTCRFLDRYFEGAYSLENYIFTSRSVKISPTAFAGIIITVMKRVNGQSVLELSSRLAERDFILTLNFDTGLMQKEEIAKITALAADCGFEISIYKSKIQLTSATVADREAIVRASQPRAVYRALCRALSSTT